MKIIYVAVRNKNAYEVSRLRDGSISCNCMRFLFRRKCDHIEEYYERQLEHAKEGTVNNDFS